MNPRLGRIDQTGSNLCSVLPLCLLYDCTQCCSFLCLNYLNGIWLHLSWEVQNRLTQISLSLTWKHHADNYNAWAVWITMDYFISSPPLLFICSDRRAFCHQSASTLSCVRWSKMVWLRCWMLRMMIIPYHLLAWDYETSNVETILLNYLVRWLSTLPHKARFRSQSDANYNCTMNERKLPNIDWYWYEQLYWLHPFCVSLFLALS